jgi:hypothetical protein
MRFVTLEHDEIKGEGIMFLRLITMVMLPMVSMAMNADETLKKIDESRSFGDEFAFTMKLTSFKNNKAVEAYELSGYVLLDEKKQSSSLVYFSKPQEVEGRKMLMKGANVWMHFPKTRNIIRLTPLQLLLGQVSNGDIARISFTADYTADFDPKLESDSTVTLKLTIRETSLGTTYNSIVLHVKKNNLQLISGDFYSTGGKLLKKVKYKGYKKMLGKNFPSIMEITEGTSQTSYTILEYLTAVKKSVPRQYFRSEYLQRFHPELVK